MLILCKRCFSLLLWLSTVLPLTAALDFVSASGRFIVNNRTNGLVTLNGIWYQTSNATTVAERDPLLDSAACTRDAALMSELGFNLIYVDAIDPARRHDDCFSIFNSVGIYIAVVLRSDLFQGKAGPEEYYTTEAMKTTFQTIDAIKDYENLLAIEVGVFPEANMLDFSKYADMQKFFRAFIRDTRDYIAHNSERSILVGGTLTVFWDMFNLTMTGLYDFQTCTIPNEKSPSGAEFVGFDFVSYLEYDAPGYANKTFLQMNAMLYNHTTPVWFSRYGTSQQNGEPKYEVFDDTLNETAILYNTEGENLFVATYGPFAGGVRWEWTNVQYSEPIDANWGITILDSKGNIQLTENYNTLRDIFAAYNVDSWYSGGQYLEQNPEKPPQCSPELIVNVTSSYAPSKTLSLATDWELPTRPAGLDAIITSGASGTRGQMVDVVITTINYEIRDPKGSVITNVALSPTKSESRTTSANSATGAPDKKNSSTQKTPTIIGVAVGLGGALALGAIGFFL